MRASDLPTPGVLSNGQALRHAVAHAISRAEISAARSPSSPTAAELLIFFNACAAACAALIEGGDDDEGGEFSTSSQTFNTLTQLITPHSLRTSVEELAADLEEPLCDVKDMMIAGANTQFMDIGSVITASSYENVSLATEAPEGGTWADGYIVGAAIMDIDSEGFPVVVAQSRAIGSLYNLEDGSQVAVISNIVNEGFPYTVTNDNVQTALNPGDPEMNTLAGITETSLTVSKVFDDRDAVLASIFPECPI